MGRGGIEYAQATATTPAPPLVYALHVPEKHSKWIRLVGQCSQRRHAVCGQAVVVVLIQRGIRAGTGGERRRTIFLAVRVLGKAVIAHAAVEEPKVVHPERSRP